MYKRNMMEQMMRAAAEIEMKMQEEEEKEAEMNPLMRFSTTELKAELRRRKNVRKGKL